MKKSWLIGGLAAAAVAFSALLAFMYALPLDFRERIPIQPLVFNHKAHAGDNGIHCLFCHRYAAKSPVAGLPPVSFCMTTCHPLFNFKIEELEEYGRNRTPIPWIRVYSLPDHVYFPHMMHVRAGIDCANCHGDVAAMNLIERTVDLKMGWCLNCHRQHKATIDCWTCHI